MNGKRNFLRMNGKLAERELLLATARCRLLPTDFRRQGVRCRLLSNRCLAVYILSVCCIL